MVMNMFRQWLRRVRLVREKRVKKRVKKRSFLFLFVITKLKCKTSHGMTISKQVSLVLQARGLCIVVSNLLKRHRLRERTHV